MDQRRRTITAGAVAAWAGLPLMLLAPGVCAQEAEIPEAPPVEVRTDQVNINQSSAIGVDVRVTLSNNDVLTGSITDNTGGFLTIENTVLGTVQLPITDIISVVPTLAKRQPDEQPVPDPPDPPPPVDPPPADPPPADPAPADPPPADPPPSADPPKPKPKAKWSSEISFGLDGREGRTDTVTANLRFNTRRDSPSGRFTFDTRYRVSEREGDRNVNRVTANASNDFKFEDSRYSLFLRGSGEVNEFANFDYRLAFNGGAGYQFIQNDETQLVGRLGAGISRDFGSPFDDEWDPEMTLSAEFAHRVTENQRFRATGELFPDLDEVGEYRAVTDASYDIKVDTQKNLSLRFSVRYEFDSESVNINENDLSYSARIVFGF